MTKKKTVEKGWRERAGLEKRRGKSTQPEEIYVDPRQMSLWEFIDPTGEERRRCGLLPDSGDSLSDVLGDFK